MFDNLSESDKIKLIEFAETIPDFTYIINKHKISITINLNNITYKVNIYFFNGDYPDKLRGYQFDFIWIDEWLKLTYAAELFEQINFCLRKGLSKGIITTTPVKHDALLEMIGKIHKLYITKGSSRENTELSNTFKNYINNCENKELISREIEANITNVRLWSHNSFIYCNVLPECHLFRIGIDMAITSGNVGIVLIGIRENHIYVLKDYAATSLNWIVIIKQLVSQHYPIEIIYETNQGGDLILSLLHLHNIRCNIMGLRVNTSKKSRHMNLAVYYQLKLITHTRNVTDLENEMLLYRKYDRIDALYCALHNIDKIMYINYND